jgi:hypothetical protein
MHIHTAMERLDRLREHPQNPRQGDVGAIIESLQARRERMPPSGQYRPIVAQASTGYVLAGNHVLRALRELDAPEVWTAWIDVTDEEALRILLADNRTADLATYDTGGLAALLTDLSQEYGLGGTGYDSESLDRLIADVSAPPLPVTRTTAGTPRPPRPPEAEEERETREQVFAALLEDYISLWEWGEQIAGTQENHAPIRKWRERWTKARP